MYGRLVVQYLHHWRGGLQVRRTDATDMFHADGGEGTDSTMI